MSEGVSRKPTFSNAFSGVTLPEQSTNMSQDVPPVSVSSIPHKGKLQYDRDFLLGFQFMPICKQKPEGLPSIKHVVLDNINPLNLLMRTLEACTLENRPASSLTYSDLRRSAPEHREIHSPPKEEVPLQSLSWKSSRPRKIANFSMATDDFHLKKTENAWKPIVKRDGQNDDTETVHTQALFRKVRSILNKLTPQMFDSLMKQMTELTVDTEERLKGVIELIFEKAINEPNFSVTYAKMCQCLSTLKVPMTRKPGSSVKFSQLLLNCCKKEFEKGKADDDMFEKKQKEVELAKTLEEKASLQELLEESRNKARRRSIGNIKFIGELFQQKMLSEAIMHNCMVRLLNHCDEESLECLCRLLTTIGKDLDLEKLRMDQYFHQIEKIVKEKKTSSRVRFMLQDVIDLRQLNWVPRRAKQEPKTIEEIHKEAEIEKQEEHKKVEQRMTKDHWRSGIQRVEEGDWNVERDAKHSQMQNHTKIQKRDDNIKRFRRTWSDSYDSGCSRGADTTERETWWTPARSFPSSCKSDTFSMRTSHENKGQEKNDKPKPPSTSANHPSSLQRGRSRKNDLLDNEEDQKQETFHMGKQLSSSTDQNLEVRQSGVQRVEEGDWNVEQDAKHNQMQNHTKIQKRDDKIKRFRRTWSDSYDSGCSRGADTTERETWWTPARSFPSSCKSDTFSMRTSHENKGQKKNDKPNPPSTSANHPSSLQRGRSRKNDLLDSEEDQKQEAFHMGNQLSSSTEQNVERKVIQSDTTERETRWTPARSFPSSCKSDTFSMRTSHENKGQEKNDKPKPPSTSANHPSSLQKGRSRKNDLLDNEEDQKQETFHMGKQLSSSTEQNLEVRQSDHVPPAQHCTDVRGVWKCPMSGKLKRNSSNQDEVLHLNGGKGTMWRVAILGFSARRWSSHN